MTISIGTPVKITGGTHKGKKGTVSTNRPTNGHQKGKIPVVVGAKNDLYWVAPNWVCENFPPVIKEPQSVDEVLDNQCPLTEPIELSTPISQLSEKEIAFAVGDYVTADGKKTGLIKSESGGIFEIFWDDDDSLLCTIEDLKEHYKTCGHQLELLDSSRASADSAEQSNSLAELSQKASPTDSAAATCTAEQSSPNKQRSHSNESNTSTPLSPGKQWLDPSLIIIRDGTQSRDVDVLYETDTPTVQRYAELMAEDLWEWEREPLPVPFLSESGKVYASDCHHRVSAAVLAKKKIFVDLRAGELIDAVIHSCTSNTSHGLPLRPKDQRKRIELFLDALSKLDEMRSHQLLDSVPNLTEIERKNGNWSARVIAKYLKLTESGYRTIINIFQERDMVEKFSHFKIGDWVHPTHWAEGAIAEIRHFNKRNGVFVVVEDGTSSEWVHPGNLVLAEKPVTPPTIPMSANSPTSVHVEEKQQAANLGIPANGLPDVGRNEGDPQSLESLSDHVHELVSEYKTPTADVCATVSALVSAADFLSDADIEAIWIAIATRVTKLGLLEVQNAQT